MRVSVELNRRLGGVVVVVGDRDKAHCTHTERERETDKAWGVKRGCGGPG